jgi:hypothetical protein
LSSAQGEAQSQVPAAGGMHGDYMDQATADSERVAGARNLSKRFC